MGRQMIFPPSWEYLKSAFQSLFLSDKTVTKHIDRHVVLGCNDVPSAPNWPQLNYLSLYETKKAKLGYSCYWQQQKEYDHDRITFLSFHLEKPCLLWRIYVCFLKNRSNNLKVWFQATKISKHTNVPCQKHSTLVCNSFQSQRKAMCEAHAHTNYFIHLFSSTVYTTSMNQ